LIDLLIAILCFLARKITAEKAEGAELFLTSSIIITFKVNNILPKNKSEILECARVRTCSEAGRN
jgi:hypothetical protein